MRGAAHVVCPVVNGRGAGAECFREAEAHRTVTILGTIIFAEPRRHGEIAVARVIRADNGPKKTCPEMPMRIDEAGYAQHTGAINDLGAGRFQVVADRNDDAIAHMHVAIIEFGEVRVHCQHFRAADHELVAGWQRCWRGGHRARVRRGILRFCKSRKRAKSAQQSRARH